jgi:hypothetical protein
MDRPDHGNLDYAAMAFGLLIFVSGWLWLGGPPETTVGWYVRIGLAVIAVGGLAVCLYLKSRIDD